MGRHKERAFRLAARVLGDTEEALEAGRLRRGDLVMMVAFGTGFSWGATLMRW